MSRIVLIYGLQPCLSQKFIIYTHWTRLLVTLCFQWIFSFDYPTRKPIIVYLSIETSYFLKLKLSRLHHLMVFNMRVKPKMFLSFFTTNSVFRTFLEQMSYQIFNNRFIEVKLLVTEVNFWIENIFLCFYEVLWSKRSLSRDHLIEQNTCSPTINRLWISLSKKHFRSFIVKCACISEHFFVSASQFYVLADSKIYNFNLFLLFIV